MHNLSISAFYTKKLLARPLCQSRNFTYTSFTPLVGIQDTKEELMMHLREFTKKTSPHPLTSISRRVDMQVMISLLPLPKEQNKEHEKILYSLYEASAKLGEYTLAENIFHKIYPSKQRDEACLVAAKLNIQSVLEKPLQENLLKRAEAHDLFLLGLISVPSKKESAFEELPLYKARILFEKNLYEESIKLLKNPPFTEKKDHLICILSEKLIKKNLFNLALSLTHSIHFASSKKIGSMLKNLQNLALTKGDHKLANKYALLLNLDLEKTGLFFKD